MFGSDMNYQIKENVGILVDGISKQFFLGGGVAVLDAFATAA